MITRDPTTACWATSTSPATANQRRRRLHVERATTLILTTTGRKSGEPRAWRSSMPPTAIADRIAVDGRAPQHPQWYRNIEANSDVQVQIKGERFAAKARTLEGDERQRGWGHRRRVVAQLPRVPGAHDPGDPGRRPGGARVLKAPTGRRRDLGRLLASDGSWRAGPTPLLSVRALHDAAKRDVPAVREQRTCLLLRGRRRSWRGAVVDSSCVMHSCPASPTRCRTCSST